MKRCGHAAQSAGAGIGAVVTLKVDFRTHSHAQGLIVIMYEMKEITGGILVCCEHGVITHDGSRNSLSEVMPVRRLGSSDVPTPEVQPLSATIDGMVPSMIPRRSASSSLPMTYRRGAGGGSCAFAMVSAVRARCC